MNKIKLKKLNISENPEFNFNKLQNISVIELECCNNNLINADFITNIKNLKTINLSHNKINHIKKLDKLHDLKFIDVSHNKLKHLDFLENLDNVNCVYDYNMIIKHKHSNRFYVDFTLLII